MVNGLSWVQEQFHMKSGDFLFQLGSLSMVLCGNVNIITLHITPGVTNDNETLNTFHTVTQWIQSNNFELIAPDSSIIAGS